MTGPANPAPARRHRRPRTRAVAQLSLLAAAALLIFLAVSDRSNIAANQRQNAAQQAQLERVVADLARQQAELDEQRRRDCLLFAARAYQQLPATATQVDRCLVIGAAAAVDNARCLPRRPVRPDLDTSEDEINACLAALSAPGPSPAQTPGR